MSDGPEFRTLPSSRLPFDRRSAQLAGLGLNGIEARRRFSETVARRSVIAWQVQGDADAHHAGRRSDPAHGETIVMTLSMGPEPPYRHRRSPARHRRSQATLADLQLVFERGDDVFSDTYRSAAS